MWGVLPPLDWHWLAWIAPVAWLLLIRRRTWDVAHPYRILWLAGFVNWMGTTHFLRLPHWATSFGWVALSFYLAFYVPIFVGLSRVAVHRRRWPLCVAAPIVWTGLEFAKAYLLSGFGLGNLGHTQYRWTSLIQISDLCGAYGVSFAVMLIAACIARAIPWEGARFTWRPLVLAAVCLGAMLGYGEYRLGQSPTGKSMNVALIQGSIDTELKADPMGAQRIHDEYFKLTLQALREHDDVDLIVWPETMYRNSLVTHDPDAALPEEAEISVDQLPQFKQARERLLGQAVRFLPRPTPMLLGVEVFHYAAERVSLFNSAVLVDREGHLTGRYDKRHLVMFGEYVPFAERFPWLYRLTPLGGGLAEGVEAQPSMELHGKILAVNICYESVLPHVIRRQVRHLRRQGTEPDVLVNLTNDGWFWGSSELDLHLICGVFRAVECRKPFLIAANTGFSAWIDSQGRIREQGPRRRRGIVMAEVELDGRRSPYLLFGDWPAGSCLSLCGILGVYGFYWRKREKGA